MIISSFPVISGLGGGSKREYYVLNEFLKYVSFELYIPFLGLLRSLELSEINEKIRYNVIKSLNDLERKGAKIPSLYFDIIENENKIVEMFKNKKISYVLNLEKFEKQIVDRLIKSKEINPNKHKIIYSAHETLDSIYPGYYLANKFNKKFFILLQEAPSLRFKYLVKFSKYNTTFVFYKGYTGIKNNLIFSYFRNTKVLSVSPACILLSDIIKYIKDFHILKIGNAFDKKIIKYRKKNKKDHLVYFSRLVPEKGLYEIPFIINEVKKVIEDIRIFIIGSFINKIHKVNFLKLIRKLNVEDNIIIKGFLNEKKLYKTISSSKLFIYPSHQDSFSLSVLESLALGTSVVAYDIPAIKYVYSDLKPVKIVREGNIKEFSKIVIDFILNKNKYEYLEEHFDEKVRKFLNMHSSWHNVALEELNILFKNKY